MRTALEQEPSGVAWSTDDREPYYLDRASITAAFALPLPEQGKILDMCAAPGGKSLILAGRMSEHATLVSNEYSQDRRKRLQTVLDQFLEPSIRSRVRITGHDASRWCRYEQNAYEAILIDAPCSSERHVLSSPVHLSQWTPARIKNLAHRQWSLLSGAWLVLKAGGYMVYSTCALSPDENDNVIEKLYSKYPDVEILSESAPAMHAEKTRFGYHILPDTASGAGPIYFSTIHKKGE